jgi:UTP---glucose-1-phosphate uridylyltransferase
MLHRRLFRQPMVPVVGAADGRWPLAAPLAPMMKPGGHGAIWKLMLDEGIFDWLAAHRREAALVRQIRCCSPSGWLRLPARGCL